jgi:lysophospholipase L1-like esterase
MTTVYFLGDSFLQAQPSSAGFAVALAGQLGWTATIDLVGGSGYVVPGSGTKYGDRLATLIAAAPNRVFIEGGGNDDPALGGTASLASFTAAVTSFYGSLRASLPTVPLYVTAGHRMSQSFFDVLRAQAMTSGAHFIDWGDVAEFPRSPSHRLLTGTGNIGNVTGDGNRDTYLYSDNAHLTVAGSNYMARELATKMVSAAWRSQ